MQKYFVFVRVFFVGGALVGFGVLGTYFYGSEVYGLYFSKPLVCSVSDLKKVGKTAEAEVTGFIYPKMKTSVFSEDWISKQTGVVLWRKYYYLLIGADGAVVWVYSELAPDAFVKRYGEGRVALRGVWEPKSHGGQGRLNIQEGAKRGNAAPVLFSISLLAGGIAYLRPLAGRKEKEASL